MTDSNNIFERNNLNSMGKERMTHDLAGENMDRD